MYGESPAGPLTTDFRRGSVGGVPNRENTAARDFSDGFYLRRARFGVEGTIARDFNYRLLMELGGSGTEGPTRINDAWIVVQRYRALHLSAGRIRAGRPTWTMAPVRKTCPSSNVPVPRSCRAAWREPTAASALRSRPMARAG